MKTKTNAGQHATHPVEPPQHVLSQFFNAFSLEEIQSGLWQMFQTSLICDNGICDTAEQRSNLLHLYNKVNECMEAGMRLFENKQVDF